MKKEKSKKVAAFLAIVFGYSGAQWFYLGHPRRGILYLLLYAYMPWLWVLYIIEGVFFLLAKKENFDKYTNNLVI